MFDGFQLDRVVVGEVTLRVRYGGAGEPVVLLHVTLARTRPGIRDEEAELHGLWMPVRFTTSSAMIGWAGRG